MRSFADFDLPKAFGALHFGFFETALKGTKEQKPRWKRAMQQVGVERAEDVCGEQVVGVGCGESRRCVWREGGGCRVWREQEMCVESRWWGQGAVQVVGVEGAEASLEARHAASVYRRRAERRERGEVGGALGELHVKKYLKQY